MARNPNWHRDELILALDLYFNMSSGLMNASNPQIVELSKILNKLPIHTIRPDEVKFRNPNGVNLKLNNFKAFDPNYDGVGMERGGKLDEEVFQEFRNERIRLHQIADQIRKTVENDQLSLELYSIENEDSSEIKVKEGRTLYKLHKFKERKPLINKKKKEFILHSTGKLLCEVCDKDHYHFYGELGYQYIECHHKSPISEIVGEVETTLDDLAVVCANCHRMLHSNISVFNVETLRNHIRI
ncbi:MAG: HNH endonuclease [Flavobacteriales bacterium]|nr:HNH endonuclease [Bacteroidota bacterium]MCB9240534.1 HNH endonuclease [Flavobacteriales bacterium]